MNLLKFTNIVYRKTLSERRTPSKESTRTIGPYRRLTKDRKKRKDNENVFPFFLTTSSLKMKFQKTTSSLLWQK